MNKLVSIVLPTYNGESFLKTSIQSCLDQTYNNIELIIVNDCSIDKTEQIINNFKDKRIRYIKNEINQKLPKSLNIGFSLAEGDYFTWTSDDNYFDKDAISKMVSVLEKNEVDLVYAPYNTIDENNEITGERQVGELLDILNTNIVKACFLYKKEVQTTLKGYNPELFLVEDYDFWIRAAFCEFKFFSLDEKLYFYRFHEGSLTESRRNEISKALFKLLKHHLDLFTGANKKEYISSNLYLKLAKLSINNKKIAFSYLKEAIKLDPKVILSRACIKVVFKK